MLQGNRFKILYTNTFSLALKQERNFLLCSSFTTLKTYSKIHGCTGSFFETYTNYLNFEKLKFLELQSERYSWLKLYFLYKTL